MGLVSAGGSEARLRADSAFVLAPYVRDYIRCISPQTPLVLAFRDLEGNLGTSGVAWLLGRSRT